MIFEPGRDKDGRTPLLADGKPIFATCGEYLISRAVTGRGILSDAWHKPHGASQAEQLSGGVTTRQAHKACEDHRNGLLNPVP